MSCNAGPAKKHSWLVVRRKIAIFDDSGCTDINCKITFLRLNPHLENTMTNHNQLT